MGFNWQQAIKTYSKSDLDNVCSYNTDEHGQQIFRKLGGLVLDKNDCIKQPLALTETGNEILNYLKARKRRETMSVEITVLSSAEIKFAQFEHYSITEPDETLSQQLFFELGALTELPNYVDHGFTDSVREKLFELHKKAVKIRTNATN